MTTEALDYSLLKRLTQGFGPSGSEEGIAEIITAEIKPYCDEIYRDTLGNLIARKNGSQKKIMIAAHMDEIGIMVTHIDEHGYLRFTTIGGGHVNELPHQRVYFRNGHMGIIGVEKLEKPTDLKLEKMYIDLGVTNRTEAQKIVEIGDSAVFNGPFEQVGQRLSSKALDDRIGCFVAIEAMKRANSSYELLFVFTVQEEVGLRGAQTAAYALEPDLALAVDVTLTGDTPKTHRMDVKLGHGAAIKVYDRSMVTSPKIKRWMAEVAAREHIPYQWEVLEAGRTDSGAIHLTKGGIPAGVISIPARYVHSPSEMVDSEDVAAAVQLLTALLEDLGPEK
ncbi:M42 family metallopeptidase [Paradesulfitobacterium ferrireducens]|uniref:M42 family metallopeptidase n=1 Tax=Paradesulfitobacterium ferrireducens TaxID=2816476 RepID=UPI001A8CD069|nr:M42 family metallopeptidase [Paradesulfitobacterium ferrireducens]